MAASTPASTDLVEPQTLMFRDDGIIPNNALLPLLLYRRAIDLSGTPDPEPTIEEVFSRNGWGDMWRNGIYPFTHYHSRIHEALGVARGRARVRFGGKTGEELEIEAGDLSRRIPVSDVEDEFARLNRDINRMMDRIEHLMNGVRHVSNAIAHDLRTPLGRIRSRLEEALRPGDSTAQLAGTARFAIQQVDELIQMLDRLLQIAEAESGARRQSFTPVPLASVLSDVVELYDATAEAEGIALVSEIEGRPVALGDRNLLTSAAANLLDNALKYAGSGATVRVRAIQNRDSVSIMVQDDGPGIPPAERSRVVDRFYRLDRSRSLPGNGLGLSIVTAIASLHWGKLHLDDADPGLLASLVLPRADIVVAQHANPMETERLEADD